MRSFWFRAVVWTVVLLLPVVPILADVNAAMLYAKGRVTVNGSAAPNSQAVFAGDQIRTGKDSVVTIALQGSNVTVMANSGVVLGENSITVGEGRAVVITSRGMVASVGGLRISPAAGQKARFEVVQLDRRVQVSALEGRLSISDGKQTTMLDAGKQLTTAASSMGNAPAGASSLTGAAIALIIAAISGAAAAAAIASTREQADTSPSTFNP